MAQPPFKLSEALGRIQPSATMAMSGRVTKLKAQGLDIIGLSAGEPDFDTPDFVKEAAIKAIQDGDTNYTTVDGTAAVKEAVAAKFLRDNDLTYAPSQISVNSGGKHTLFNALVATLDAGDEVIIPAPYWVSYPDMVNFAGGNAGHYRGGRGSELQDYTGPAECGDYAKDEMADPQLAVQPDRCGL